MKAKSLKAACLAVGLATAWGGQADAQLDQIQLTIAPSNNLSHVYFIYGSNGSTLYASFVALLPDLVGGTSTTETFFVDHNPFDPRYTVIGLYDAPNKGLTISMWNPDASGIYGNSFGDVFSPIASLYGFTFYSEDTLATAMLSNDTVTIMNAISSEQAWGVPFGVSADLVNFSNASNGGSLSADMIAVNIPEPSSIYLVSFSALALLVSHRAVGYRMLFRRKRTCDS